MGPQLLYGALHGGRPDYRRLAWGGGFDHRMPLQAGDLCGKSVVGDREKRPQAWESVETKRDWVQTKHC